MQSISNEKPFCNVEKGILKSGKVDLRGREETRYKVRGLINDAVNVGERGRQDYVREQELWKG